MSISHLARSGLCYSAATAALLLAMPHALAADATGARVIMPPMSVPTAHYYATHPDAFARLLSRLPKAPADTPALTSPRFTTKSGGTWTAVAKGAPGLSNPLLLTDGTVIVASAQTPYWYRLTPDINGNYATGTWSQIAPLPEINGKPYAPLYHASAVLPDGRVIIMGGEYNGNKAVWTNEGAIYDPVANTWTAVNPPLGTAWGMIGDAQSVVLSNGTFMLASCCAFYPAADALLNAKKLTWVRTGAPRFGGWYQDEQGYELLPNDYVLTVDVFTYYPTNANPYNAEIYKPNQRKWYPTGTLPVSLVDPAVCGTYEIGPAVLRGDGTVVGFGGNTGCVAGATDDPTAIYTTSTNSWVAGPNIPAVCGSDGATSCDLADAPAALLPDGNILFAASAGYGGMPTHFFEYSPTNTITQVSDTLHFASTSGAYYYNFLVLPSGQILSTDFSRRAEIYTPAGSPVANWAPVIYDAPTSVTPGKTYMVVGAQLNGVSQGAYYGDDVQMATNYPIVRFTNVATGHVFYARSFKFSAMSVTPKALGSANFMLPTGAETGSSTMEVIANGIASKPVLVTVK